MALSGLLRGLAEVDASASGVQIEDISLDSRQVEPGHLFVAVQGEQVHGMQFAEMAERSGAVAVLSDERATERPANLGIPVIDVPNLSEHLGLLASRFYQTDDTQVARLIGVTGTNGKSSVVHLLSSALNHLGVACASIGTLGAHFQDNHIAVSRTTPDVFQLHRLVAALRNAGAKAIAMEVSSHGLDQGRCAGLAFDTAIFTNLTRDHLDYHLSMAAYIQAKAKLFQWDGLRLAVVNADDSTVDDVLPADATKSKTVRYGLNDAQVLASGLKFTDKGLRFTLQIGHEDIKIKSKLIGAFNVYNLLAVAATLWSDGYSLPDIKQAIKHLAPVPGRMERVTLSDPDQAAKVLVIVDYAHTPDALQNALQSARHHTAGKLICVFGCGGDRDKGKRPLMAAVAERLADFTIVTDDNPRTEDGDEIVTNILSGMAREAYQVIRDRRAAINTAITMAGTNDTVLVAGKGHETYQEIDGVSHPFDDRLVVREALEEAA